MTPPIERRLARERPASLPLAKLPAEIRRAGIVPHLSGTYPNPSSLIVNLILETDCRKPAPNPCKRPEIITRLESYSCAKRATKSHRMILLYKKMGGYPPGIFLGPMGSRDNHPRMCTYEIGQAKPFRIRTYGNKDLKSFRMRTYEKEKGEGGSAVLLPAPVWPTLRPALSPCV